MFYVNLGLSISHRKFSFCFQRFSTLFNIDTNSIVASEKYFSMQESFTKNSFIITESRNTDYPGDRSIDRFLVSVGLLFKFSSF